MPDRAAPPVAPATDLEELTSEMIEAGVVEYLGGMVPDPGLREAQAAVRAIFEAMSRLAPRR